jgi:acetyl-CoA synthetase
MTDTDGETLSNLLHEERRFPAAPDPTAAANATAAGYARADTDRLAFWAAAAARLDWARLWDEAGDGAKKDDDGDLWPLGRVDDVMNVSG